MLAEHAVLEVMYVCTLLCKDIKDHVQTCKYCRPLSETLLKSVAKQVWGKTGGKIYGPTSGLDYEDNQFRFSLLAKVCILRSFLPIGSVTCFCIEFPFSSILGSREDRTST